MKKGFYIGQPLIIKHTGEKVTFAYDDGKAVMPCNIFRKFDDGTLEEDYYEYEDIEPSTEFKFSEIIAGLEQGYFEVGTEFEMKGTPECKIKVSKGMHGLYLKGLKYGPEENITSRRIKSTWQLVEPCKEMTLEEIESELGYKIKLINT